MVEKELEKAFIEAAEIATKLPKNLQETGFNKALEQLLSKYSSATGTRHAPAAHRPEKGAASTRHTKRGGVPELIDAIDRTAYPDVGSTGRIADRALKVLQLAHKDHGIDGLTANEIATILTQKFRLPVRANSVAKALERETDTVDIRSGSGASRVFHIMAPGEDYLAKLRPDEGAGRQHKAAAKASQQVKAAKRSTPGKKKAPREATSKKTGRRPGPKAAVGQLIQSGFFHAARTIAEIRQELQHRRGHTYSMQELAPALVRSIRDESLKRDRNDAGQYEYSQA